MRLIITGAASGIGRALAQRLAPGNSLLLVDRDAPQLATLAAELAPASRIATAIADLADPETAAHLVAEALETFGGLDGIASNAGIMRGGELQSLSLADYESLFHVNTRATWLLGKAAHPHLTASRGAIIATASLAGEQPAPLQGAYSASKAALIMLIRQMALEWGPQGIRCNCVSPGSTRTAINESTYADPARLARREAMLPLRKLAEPEDIAAVIAFLFSADAAQITGQNLLVDGGLSTALMALGRTQP